MPERVSTVLAAIVLFTAAASTGEAPKRGVLAVQAPPAKRMPQAKEMPHRATTSYGKLPLHFEANHGQTDDQVKFLARGSGYGLFLTSTESVLVLRKAETGPTPHLALTEPATPKPSSPPQVLRMKLLGADPCPAVEGRDELPGKSNYFIGNDPKKWRTNVPQYARVEYKDVYPGVSLAYYGNQRQLEYDFIVSPGSDPSQIRLGIEGADDVRVDAEGNLVLSLPGGEVVEKAPVVYQAINGARKAVEGRFVVKGKGEVGFEVGAYEADRPLVLDPLLVYSTYLGGSGDDYGDGIAVDASGSAYVIGFTTSTDFPTASPLQAANGGGYNFDAFVSKLNAAGTGLVYSTYLGGNGYDEGYGIAVDASGSAYMTGVTSSTNFPTVNPLQGMHGGGVDDAFVAKLNASGSALVYSTYLGGNGFDVGIGIGVDASGDAYVTGGTYSTDFPTANPIQATSGGYYDAFVAKLNASGSALVYSTYLGGNGQEYTYGFAVDAAGNAYVIGETDSTNFPTANALQAAKAGVYNAFVAKVNASGSAFVYSTYLGGSLGDTGRGIAVDPSGNAYVTGYTFSTDFPTVNPLQATHGGGFYDAFVAKLNASGSALVFSTYLGGSGDDFAYGIAVDALGNAYVTGGTTSTNFPTASPVQGAYGGGGGLYEGDAFVTKLSAAGSVLVYSTYLGGSGIDSGFGIALDASGTAYVTGYTTSTNFPTANPLQAANGGGYDAFVAKSGALADVSIAKTDGQAIARAGNPVTYTITVTNGGPDAVVGATVNDTVPSTLAGLTWTCTASTGSSCGAASGSGNIAQTVDLRVAGTATFVATGTLDINAFGTLSNTATVTPSAGFTDPNLANNSATDTDTIVSLADLSITKTDGQTTASPGQPVTYTIVASNAGPTDVTWAFVSDTLPASPVAATWTCVGAGGGICTVSGAGSIYDFVHLPVGASVTYALSTTVSLTASTFSNTATITPATVIVNDPNLANNTATDTDLVTCGNVVVVVPDGRLTNVTVASGATAWFGATVKIGNSYSVEFKNATGSLPPGPLTVFKGDDSCNVGSTLTTTNTSTIDPPGTGGLTRASFTATGTQSFFQAMLVNTTGGPVTLTFGWSETSLFSPAWSTNGSFDTYYAFQNTTGVDLSGTLALLNTSGALVTTFDVSVPAGQTVGTNTMSLGVIRNRTGTAKFTHNGPPGSIVVEAAIANFTLSPAYVQPVKFQATREAR